MPLRIKMPSKDRIIVNGAVIENAGEATTIVLHNRADVLRRKEVMAEEEANSPARRIYYALQCAYIFHSDRRQYIEVARDFLGQYVEAAPSALEMANKVISLLNEQKYYNALRQGLKLIEHEDERMGTIQRDSD